jgi:DtxR family Mn-dependent transcriptional regulator
MEKNQREKLEDLLEAVWLRREANRSFSPSRYRSGQDPDEAEALVRRLVADGLLRSGDDSAELTRAGEVKAAQIVRRHRLAERLFSDLFSTDVDETGSLACRFEHILNEEVTEAVCTLLGHPPTCPHGRRIPPGRCCKRAVREVKSLVKPLSDCTPGSRVRIVFITPSAHQRLDRLNSLGILPGEIIHLHQKQPSFVIRVGATEVAIEKDVAREIYAIKLD